MASKRTRPIRVDVDNYKELKKMSEKTGFPMRIVIKTLIGKAKINKKELIDIPF